MDNVTISLADRGRSGNRGRRRRGARRGHRKVDAKPAVEPAPEQAETKRPEKREPSSKAKLLKAARAVVAAYSTCPDGDDAKLQREALEHLLPAAAIKELQEALAPYERKG